VVRDFIKFNCLEKKILGVLLFLILLLLGSYSYFIDQSVKNIVSRKNIEREMALLNASLGSLELDYVSSQAKVGSELAYSLGFSDSGDVYFVSKELRDSHLTLNDEN
jgi:hypothetical protein